MDTGDCQPLYHAIRDFYEGMNMRIDQQIPILLVERQALNEAIIGEKNVFYCLLYSFPSQFCLNFMDEYLILKKYFLSRGSITCRRPGACVFRKSRLSPLYVLAHI